MRFAYLSCILAFALNSDSQMEVCAELFLGNNLRVEAYFYDGVRRIQEIVHEPTGSPGGGGGGDSPRRLPIGAVHLDAAANVLDIHRFQDAFTSSP